MTTAPSRRVPAAVQAAAGPVAAADDGARGRAVGGVQRRRRRLFGLVTAFQNYDPLVGVWHSEWAGVDQFRQLFGDPLFWEALKNTLYLSSVQLILDLAVMFGLGPVFAMIIGPRIYARRAAEDAPSVIRTDIALAVIAAAADLAARLR